MPSLGEQRQGMGANAGDHQQHDVSESHTQRDLKHSLGTTSPVSVDVHLLSVRAAEAGFKRRAQHARYSTRIV